MIENFKDLPNGVEDNINGSLIYSEFQMMK